MELSGSNIKKFVIFSQKKSFLIFRELETTKNSLYFRKRNFLIFQETETLKNLLYFRREFSSQKNKKKTLLKCFLYFGKWNFLAPSLKNSFYFRKELIEPEHETKYLLRRSSLTLGTVL